MPPGATSLFTPTRDRLLVLSWIVGGCFVAVQVHAALTSMWGPDSITYWSVWSRQDMYDEPPELHGAFLYSPAFAQLFYPLTLLPWPVFCVLWLALGTATYLWLIRPVGWVWGVPLFALALEDLRDGNVTWLVILSMLAGLRIGPAWCFPLFTKIASAVGVLWFVPRRQWRQLAAFALMSAAIFAVSYALSPDLWHQWFTFLAAHGSPTAAVRLAIGATLVLVASRSNRPWLMPFAMMIASPVFAVYVAGFLCALPRLLPEETLAQARLPFGGFGATMRRALDLPPE